MSYLFDTNACIHLMKQREPLTGRAREAGPSAIAITAITLAEMWFGAANCYADARAHLAAKGHPIGDRDLMIAAIALANRLTVVTSNLSEFGRVPGVTVEDWMR